MKQMNSSLRLAVLVIAAPLLMTAALPAQDDTVHVRGSNYDGVDSSSTIVLPWPDTGPTVLWRRPLGQGYSGFIIVGRKAYSQMQHREGQFVICLDLHTGATIWKTRYNWPWQMDGDWPGPYATPTYYKGHIYFAGALGQVGCMDAENGKLKWARNLIKEFDAKGVSFGYASTPLVMFDKIFIPVGGKAGSVIALKTVDGSTAWKSGDDEASYSSSIPVVVAGVTQIVSYLSSATVANDPQTGRELWRHNWGSGYSPHGTWPLYQEPNLLRTHPFKKGCRVDRIKLSENAYALEPVWANKTLCADFLSPVLTGDHVYGYDVRTPQADRDGKTRGHLVCLDFQTGETCWRTNTSGHTSVQVSDGKLLMLNENGILIIAETNSEQYTELARYPILPGDICWTMPTVAHNFLIARNQKDAVCIYLGTTPPAGCTAISEKMNYGGSHWLDTFDNTTMWMPDWGNLFVWFLVCAVGIILPFWLVALSLPTDRRLSSGFGLFTILTVTAGVSGTWVIGLFLGRFVFTWPVALFALLLWIQTYAVKALKSGKLVKKLIARLFLILFALSCLFFWHICGRLYLLGGWGFLTGFLPAIPFMQAAARKLLSGKNQNAALLHTLISFTIYFWVSAVILVWRTGIES